MFLFYFLSKFFVYIASSVKTKKENNKFNKKYNETFLSGV